MHEHADHTAGLDDIRPFCFRQGALELYADAQVQNALRQRFAYIFETENKYPGAPTANLNTLQKTNLLNWEEKSYSVEVLHNQLSVMGFRIDDFAYLTDVKTIAAEERQKLQNLDVLIISAFAGGAPSDAFKS